MTASLSVCPCVSPAVSPFLLLLLPLASAAAVVERRGREREKQHSKRLWRIRIQIVPRLKLALSATTSFFGPLARALSLLFLLRLSRLPLHIMVYCVEAHRVSGVWLAHRLVREPIALVGVVSSMRVDGGVAWVAMAAEIEVMIVMAAAA